ncbi:MAG: hypothetical protein ACI9R3_006298 [Verrucomicrobiales bacterium]|jgi:hypothetical protein
MVGTLKSGGRAELGMEGVEDRSPGEVASALGVGQRPGSATAFEHSTFHDEIAAPPLLP